MQVSVELELKNKERFLAAINRAKQVSEDLTLPLTLITKDFYKSQQGIFQLKGPGQYADLSKKYKAEKAALLGSAYPILKRSGRLEKSVTNPNSPDAWNYIVNKDTLILESRVEYGIFHQLGTSKMPRRPFFFIGPEAPTYATDEMKGRAERWLNILNSYVLRKLKQEIDDSAVS